MINLGSIARTRGRKGGLHAEYLVSREVMNWLDRQSNGFCTQFGRFLLGVTARSIKLPESPRAAAEAKRLLEELRRDLAQMMRMDDLPKNEVYSVPVCITVVGRKKYFTDLHEQVHAKFAQIRNRSNDRMDTERMIYMGLMRLLGPEQGHELIPQMIELSIEKDWSDKNYPRHMEEVVARSQQLIRFMATVEYQTGQLKKREAAADAGITGDDLLMIPYNYRKLAFSRRQVKRLDALKKVTQKIQDRFGNVYRFAEWMENNITPEMVAAFTPQLVWATPAKPK